MSIREIALACGIGWDEKYHWFVSAEQLEKFAEIIMSKKEDAEIQACFNNQK